VETRANILEVCAATCQGIHVFLSVQIGVTTTHIRQMVIHYRYDSSFHPRTIWNLHLWTNFFYV